ncbi:hypothetical protein [Neisseria shayeganii]|uniref:Uncharacterized protein n=1 Tax=Neisseria shayeganii 871 TaxID=1032488 RepID=G4CGG2_9NEIS|nr:hypothetical protein HMPREF9371_0701 [Neisseria shayeganii 871]
MGFCKGLRLPESPILYFSGSLMPCFSGSRLPRHTLPPVMDI